MDKLDTTIAQYQNLKYEQKLRRIEFVGPDTLFYALPTEVTICKELEKLKLKINKLFNK